MTAETRLLLTPKAAVDAPIPVQSMRLDRGLVHPVGRAEFCVPGHAPVPEVGSDVTISVRQEGETRPLLSGFIAAVSQAVGTIRLTVLEPAARLMRFAPAQSFSEMTVGQIISDLCDQAGITPGRLLPGARIPHIVLRTGRTRLDHAIRLARMSGQVLSSDTDGALLSLALTIPEPSTPPKLDRAALARSDYLTENDGSDLRVVGAGAMGVSGPGASTLPLSDLSLISAGASDAPKTERIAALRALSDVALAQLALSQRHKAPQAGVIYVTPLAEGLSPGDAVMLPDATGLPIRLARLETLAITMSAEVGFLCQYRFSDLEMV